MAATPKIFKKSVSISVSSGEALVGIVNRSYSDWIQDLTTVEVYFNGQLIPGGLHPVSPTSKYYYDLTITPGAYNPATGAWTSVPEAAFILKGNTAYTGTGYTSGTSNTGISTFDTFTISYYYVVYTV